MARLVPALRTSIVLALASLLTGCASGAAPTAPPATSTIAPAPAVSATAVATPAPSAGPTATPGPVVEAGEPWIAFQQFTPTSTVMLVRPDGSGLHSPTGEVPGGDQTNPDWSPDGSQLVFAVDTGEREVLWVVDADGTDARLLADCTDDCAWLDDPDWSPDGGSVLFSRNRVTSDRSILGSLEVVDIATGAMSVLVQAAPGQFYAGQRWSPDGAQIVVEVVQLASASADAEVRDVSLAIVEAASPTPAGRELMGSGRFAETAAWAPDGRSIIFAALEAAGGSGTHLFSIRPDGTGLRQVTRDVGATHPDVSADGSEIIFSATLPGRRNPVLGRVDLDGGEIVPAAGSDFIDGVHPRLRPSP